MMILQATETSEKYRSGWGTPTFRRLKSSVTADPTEKLQALDAALPPVSAAECSGPLIN